MIPTNVKMEVGSVILNHNFMENTGERPVSGINSSWCYRKNYAIGQKVEIQGFQIPKQIVTVVLDIRDVEKDPYVYWEVWDDNNQKYFNKSDLLQRKINIFDSKDIKTISEAVREHGINFKYRE